MSALISSSRFMVILSALGSGLNDITIKITLITNHTARISISKYHSPADLSIIKPANYNPIIFPMLVLVAHDPPIAPLYVLEYHIPIFDTKIGKTKD
jgi:hypothetical protein